MSRLMAKPCRLRCPSRPRSHLPSPSCPRRLSDIAILTKQRKNERTLLFLPVSRLRRCDHDLLLQRIISYHCSLLHFQRNGKLSSMTLSFLDLLSACYNHNYGTAPSSPYQLNRELQKLLTQLHELGINGTSTMSSTLRPWWQFSARSTKNRPITEWKYRKRK